MHPPVVTVGSSINDIGIVIVVIAVLTIYIIADPFPDVNGVTNTNNNSLSKHICRPGLSVRSNLIVGGNGPTATGRHR